MKSIRNKIILISCIICIFSILSATIISYKTLSENIKEQTLEKLYETSLKHGAEIEGWLDVQVRVLDELYNEIIYRDDYNRENLMEYFKYKDEKNPDIEEYYIAFPDNVFVRGVGPWYPEGDYKTVEREWYINAAESDRIVISSPYADVNHGRLIFTLSKAIRIDGEVVGVLASDISIEHVVNIINESRPSVEGYGFLVDNKGNILAHPNEDFLYSKDKGLTNIHEKYGGDILVKYFGEKELKTIVDYDGVEKYLLYTNLGDTGLDIGLAAPVDEVMKPLDKIINSSISLALILTLISVFLTFILGNSIAKPIKVATNDIEQMAELNITKDVDPKYLKMQDELGRMFNSFQMIVNSLREFLRNLSSISTRASNFSEELAALASQSSLDADNIAQNTSNIVELNQEQFNKVSRIINSIESLHDNANSIIHEVKTENNEILIDELEPKLNEMKVLTKELKQIKNTRSFESKQVENVYSLIERQTLMMEEISSASQCLAELVDELNVYIDKFER